MLYLYSINERLFAYDILLLLFASFCYDFPKNRWNKCGHVLKSGCPVSVSLLFERSDSSFRPAANQDCEIYS